MPTGVPKNGFRMTRKRLSNGWTPEQAATMVNFMPQAIMPSAPVIEETDDEIRVRLSERFEILQIMAESAIVGATRALIVSGAPGLGKSYTVEQSLKNMNPNHRIVKGFVRATGLLKLLWAYRSEGDVLVFDDADSIFNDETSLNLLKAVCDTTEQRTVSWLSEGELLDDDGDVIPKTFDFEGTIVFITNYDFDNMIRTGHRLSPHFEALMSRSHYIDLSLKTRRDYLVRINMVVEEGMLDHLSTEEILDVLEYIEENYMSLRELSLRQAIKLANLRSYSDNWRRIADITCLRG